MKEFGFVRVGAIVPKLSLANPLKNALEIVEQVTKAYKKGVAIVTTPELSLTGYTCGDLFLQDALLNEAEEALEKLVEETKELNIITILGMPIRHDNQLFNCAVVIEKGKILGIVPKTALPNYSEFYEKRWFSSSKDLKTYEIELLGQTVPISPNLLFQDTEKPEFTFGIEICEDLWTVTPPSDHHALAGATMIFNLSSSNEVVGKQEYRKNLVMMESAKTISAYIYCSSGMMESSSDLLFGGASMIYENGSFLAENKRFQLESNLITADVDVFKLASDRRKNKSYMNKTGDLEYKMIKVDVSDSIKELQREYREYPFVPTGEEERKKRCREILEIQSSALARRLLQLGNSKCVIGISGGLDSTLAFLVIVRAYEKLGRDPKDIIGITMPGFGTTGRTYKNAKALVKEYGATLKEISIKKAASFHMKEIGLDENDRSVTYENIQARERTQILMDVANMEHGIVIGTGDLSEIALGWCTYNGDHMSMYAVNNSIPKTLVRYLVKWVADTNSGTRKKILDDILDTPISPELLPPDEAGNILQKTESSIGPYVLHDFFLYHFLRYGTAPQKIYFLACHTFQNSFRKEEIKKWLQVFIKRFYTQQFKRNCMPDGVKVGSVSLSPRGDFRMPSDANYQNVLAELEKIKVKD
ncbi:MAG TPA: NAD(+) synthase [Candidatus Onthousia faecigallinarum]|nr:NAD(+) synthase [Candidatus Onthousia faecigallinarum]